MAKTNYNGQEVETLDLTPTWEGLLPALLLVLEHGETKEARDNAVKELRNMAQAADQFRKAAIVTDAEINNSNGKNKMQLVTANAQMIFWEVIALNYPECESGDFPPGDAIQFDEACENAVDTWLMYNDPARRLTDED